MNIIGSPTYGIEPTIVDEEPRCECLVSKSTKMLYESQRERTLPCMV